MTISVRIALTDDAEELARVNIRSIQEICAKEYQGADLSQWLAKKTPENFRKCTAEPDRTMVTGLLDGQIHGVGMLMHDGWIRLCYITPEALGKGLGKAILQFLEAEAQKKGIKTIKLESTITARNFYLRNGYQPSQKESRSVLAGIQSFPMEKSLECGSLRLGWP